MMLQQRRDQRGRGGLAMGAGDGDAALQPHQLGQHLGPADHRQAQLARGEKLGIVALDRGRDHDDLGLAEILRLVADEGGDALVGEALDVGAVGGVRALHLVAEIVQHLGDAGHADAADADEMDGAELRRQLHGPACPVSSESWPSRSRDRPGGRQRRGCRRSSRLPPSSSSAPAVRSASTIRRQDGAV